MSSLDKLSNLVCIIGIFYSIFCANTVLTACAFLALSILIKLTWKRIDMPIMFAAIFTQFLSITIKVFYADFNNLNFSDTSLHRYPENIVEAYFFALMGLASLALGINFTMRSFDYNKLESIQILSLGVDKKKIRILYILLAVAYPFIFRLSFSLGGLQQPITKLIEFKWSLFLIFLFSSINNRAFKYFIITFIIELLFSFTGFFSGFKDYFIALVLGLIINYGREFKFSNLLPLTAIVGAAIYILVVWQHIKPTYRSFLNAGETSQVSVRDANESLSMLYNLATELDSNSLNDGFERTVDRISYIDFLSATMRNVPANIPHTNGSLWKGAIKKVLMPRILFPEKDFIDDSDKTRLYTGEAYMGAEDGVSISLGYFAESYVDFGKYGMLVILFLFGLLIGVIYKYVLTNSVNVMFGSAFSLPLFFIMYSYEKSLDKIFAAVLLYFISFLLVKKLLLKPMLKYLNYKAI